MASRHRTTTPSAPQEHRTVSRVVTILELVAGHPEGMTLAELATALDAPRSSVHYIAKGLVATGYLTDVGVYTLGPAVETLLGARSSSVEHLARPDLESLHDRFDETVLLSMRIGDRIVYADAIESTRPIRFSAHVGERRPLYPSSAGRCFLAHCDPAFRDDYVTRHVDDPDIRLRLHDEFARTAHDGVGFADRHTTPDLGGVHAPVFRNGVPVAVVTVAGPAARIDARLDPITEAVVAHARHITELLNLPR